MSKKVRRHVSLPLVILLLFSLAACAPATKHTKTYYTWFDTVTTVTGYGSTRSFNDACGIVEDIMERYHRSCDIYHRYAGTVNACDLNAMAGQGPVGVSPEHSRTYMR